MRLGKQQEIQATNELLAMLAEDLEWGGGHGLRTSEMRETRRFYGQNALSLKQIARLLRKTGKVVAKMGGSKRFSYNVWSLTDEASKDATINPASFFEGEDPCREMR
jgi:hypothetical protein